MNTHCFIFPFLLSAAALASDWPNYAGDKGGTRYSPLDQINRQNVARLQIAWTYHTGERPSGKEKPPLECTPIVIGGRMYLTTALTRVVALDAATGAQIWTFNPNENQKVPGDNVNRGVAYWSDGKSARIVLATADGRLFLLDAATGKPHKTVDLRAGLDRDIKGLTYGTTSAPMVFEDLVILGFTNGEGPEPSAPGDIRAFDVRTGAERWRFHTVPWPGEVGHDTWEGESWKNRGGANAWGGVSVDVKRGMVLAGLGSAAFDFYGGDRKGQNLFANCVIALNVRTGKRIWHFQTVRHDLWDYDLPTFPVLVTLRQNGREIEAVAQVTKTGMVFVLDRETGKPVFPVEDRPVPASTVYGEQAWPRQVVPLKPPRFAHQGFREEDITNLSQEAHDEVLARFRRARSEGIFTPPSYEGTIVLPGYLGGANWSGASFDPAAGVLYVNSNNVPYFTVIKKPDDRKPYPYTQNGWTKFLDKDGYPAVKPPWGLLSAIDLNRGEILWQSPLGEFVELTARGIAPTGTENLGGNIVTAGGLVFTGATKDEMFRAFDKATGRVLWETKLPAGGYAMPATYMVDQRQYVVIAAGGGGKLNTPAGDAFVTFALPSK